MPKSSEEALAASSIRMPPMTSSVGMTESLTVRARPKHTSDSGHPPPSQIEHISVKMVPSITRHTVVSPVSTGHILGEGAAIFTDITETMLTALDQQMALSGEAQKPEGSLIGNVLTSRQVASSSNIGESKTISQTANKIKDKYPDLYLPVMEYYRISDKF